MAVLDIASGCKVGWVTYSTLEEAEAGAADARVEAERKWNLGYDFGYLTPGSITHVPDHQDHGECWVVTIP